MPVEETSMAKIAMTWRWLAAAALLLAPVAAFATGEAEQGASTGAGAAMSGRFSEAPMLAARVAAGELPPVEERIPFDPVVQEMLADGVGRYGGTLRVSEAIGFMNQRGGELTTQMLDIYLLTMHQQTLEIVPNIASGYAVSDDGLTVTLELRPGTRWSNGDPFIVDDLMFVMEDMKWDDRVDPGWRAGETPTTAVSITRIDDHAMQFHMSQIDYVVIPGWTTWKGGNYVQYAPSNYLKKWHIRYNPDAQKLAEEEGFDTWAEALVAHWDIIRGVRPGDPDHDAVDRAGDQRPGGALGAQPLLLEGGPGGTATALHRRHPDHAERRHRGVQPEGDRRRGGLGHHHDQLRLPARLQGETRSAATTPSR